MNETPPTSTLTKTCASCGLPKPLSAFLQLSDTGSSIYGNICSTCRKTEKDHPKKLADEGSSTSSTGNKIDAKAKVQGDTDKLHAREELQKQHQEERVKKDFLQEMRKTKIEAIAEGEQKHRAEIKNRTFLDKKDKPSSSTAATKQFFAEETAKTTVDYTKTIGFAGEVRRHSSVFSSLQTWLGKNNNFVKNVENAGLANKDKPTGPGKKR